MATIVWLHHALILFFLKERFYIFFSITTNCVNIKALKKLLLDFPRQQTHIITKRIYIYRTDYRSFQCLQRTSMKSLYTIGHTCMAVVTKVYLSYMFGLYISLTLLLDYTLDSNIHNVRADTMDDARACATQVVDVDAARGEACSDRRVPGATLSCALQCLSN